MTSDAGGMWNKSYASVPPLAGKVREVLCDSSSEGTSADHDDICSQTQIPQPGCSLVSAHTKGRRVEARLQHEF